MKRRVLWLLIGIMGSVLVPLALGAGLLVLALILAGGESLGIAEALSVAAVMAFGLGLGIPLAVHGWAGGQAQPARPFHPSRTGWLGLVVLLLIAGGTLVGSVTWIPPLLLAPIHVSVMAFLPLLMLWMVGRALRGMGGSRREVIAGVAGGGVLGVGASLATEGLVALVLAGALVLVMPDKAEQFVALAKDLRDPTWQADPSSLMHLLLSPAVAISVLAVASIPIPLIEEFFKTLAAGVVAHWIRPHPARAFLWGVAGGAGFSLVENLFSGALGGVEGWTFGTVARFGVTAMHCLTGGLVGWGWGQLWTEKRPVRLLGAYAVAVMVHALWNAAAVGAVLLGASAWAHEGSDIWFAFTGIGTLILVGLLGSLTMVSVFVLPLAGRRLVSGVEQAPSDC